MNFKKYSPFIIPIISLFLVLFLAFRWYNLRTQRDQDNLFDEVEIENLTEEDQIVIGAPDASTIQLEPEDEDLASGQVRYRMIDDRMLFSVSADLPKDEAFTYQVWISPEEEDFYQKAFALTYSKGGYTGSASVSRDQLPLEVVVSRETDPDDQEIEQELLRGMIIDDETNQEDDLELE
jgi:hypothetical protein